MAIYSFICEYHEKKQNQRHESFKKEHKTQIQMKMKKKKDILIFNRFRILCTIVYVSVII